METNDDYAVKDLIKAGFVEEVEEEINYQINGCSIDFDTLIALDKRAQRDLRDNTHNIGQEEVITLIREFIRLKNDYIEEKENLKIAIAMLTKGTYPEKNKGDKR